ncbi:MAG: sensor histidine kinase [Phormidesmis sp.]
MVSSQFSPPNSHLSASPWRQPISTVRQWFNGLKLQHKIGWSFGLAASVAIVSITIGWGIAESSLSKARAEIQDSEAEREMLTELKVSLLRMHLHQKGAILTLNDLSQWTEVYETFIEDRETFRATWHHYKTNQEVVQGNTIYDQRERQLIEELTISYAVFSHDLDSLITQFRQVDLEQLSDSERQNLQVRLTRFNNEALRQEAYQFLNLVQALRENSEIQLVEAKATFRKSEIFRLKVIIISAFASLVITIFLIVLLSRAISSSVEKAAATAAQVIETSNFDLQIPVSSTDEVGELSTVLNRLIAQVKQLLQQEKEKSESLENALCEIRETQAVLVQSEKMSALGQMVAGVAHEINNPIGFLNGSIQNAKTYVKDLESQLTLYQQHYPNPVEPVQNNAEEIDLDFIREDFPKLLDSMTAANQRIKSISTSLRTFSRADTEHKVSADLHEGLDSTLLILKYRLKANERRPAIEVIKDYGEIPAIDCFPGQLNQVFMNLLANAIDIFDEATEQSSFAELEETPQIITVKTALDSDQKGLEIRIGDNSKGMTEDVKARIFDHLFTTKGVGKGTGLGLAIAQQIVVEKHGGSLTVQSELGQGTEFCIQLPF